MENYYLSHKNNLIVFDLVEFSLWIGSTRVILRVKSLFKKKNRYYINLIHIRGIIFSRDEKSGIYFSPRVTKKSLFSRIRRAQDTKGYRKWNTIRTQTHPFPCVSENRLNILITGALFHFPSDYRPYLHVIVASSAFTSIFPRDRFFLRHRIFLRARARVRGPHIFSRSRKKVSVTLQFTVPLFRELLLSELTTVIRANRYRE